MHATHEAGIPYAAVVRGNSDLIDDKSGQFEPESQRLAAENAIDFALDVLAAIRVGEDGTFILL